MAALNFQTHAEVLLFEVDMVIIIFFLDTLLYLTFYIVDAICWHFIKLAILP